MKVEVLESVIILVLFITGVCLIVWHTFSSHVPLHEAAQRAYEEAEKAGILFLLTSKNSSPEAGLNHFKLLFMMDDKTEVFGIKPPSTKSRIIPKKDLQRNLDLYPVDGPTSQLNYVTGSEVAYTNVTVRRKNLRRVINSYLNPQAALDENKSEFMP